MVIWGFTTSHTHLERSIWEEKFCYCIFWTKRMKLCPNKTYPLCSKPLRVHLTPSNLIINIVLKWVVYYLIKLCYQLQQYFLCRNVAGSNDNLCVRYIGTASYWTLLRDKSTHGTHMYGSRQSEVPVLFSLCACWFFHSAAFTLHFPCI